MVDDYSQFAPYFKMLFVYLDDMCSYDERSDVWSLGCILLEMATCGFLDVCM